MMSKLSAHQFARECFTEWMVTMGSKTAIPVLCLAAGLKENASEITLHVAKGTDRETIGKMLLAALKELDHVEVPG